MVLQSRQFSFYRTICGTHKKMYRYFYNRFISYGCSETSADANSDRNSNTNVNKYACLLQACTTLRSLSQVHAHILINGCSQNFFLASKLMTVYSMLGSMDDAQHVFDTMEDKSNVLLWNVLISLYTKGGFFDFARQLFDKMPVRDVVSWNSMIIGYAQNGRAHVALGLFVQMQQRSMRPNMITVLDVIQACGRLDNLIYGKWIHGFVVRSGFESNVAVSNSLLSMYTRCGSIEFAKLVFEKMAGRNLVSWNAMIAGYAQNGLGKEAFLVFKEMRKGNVAAGSVTLMCALQACAHLGALEQGKCIHGYIIRNRLESDVSLRNSLLSMHSRCRNIEYAHRVFVNMTERDVISWSSLIAGYNQSQNHKESIHLYHQMRSESIMPDSVTMASVLQACTHLGVLQEGKVMHSHIIKFGFETDVFIGNSLIDMYSKCGEADLSLLVFERMSTKNVISWNSIIGGYVQNGQFRLAMNLFHEMQKEGPASDACTVVVILQACAHLKVVHRGKCIHGYIIKARLDTDVFVQNSLIDMYAKCEDIDSARHLFDQMYGRNIVSWSAMIGGYSQSGLPNEALTLFLQMQLADLKPNIVTVISVLQACSHLAALQQGKRIHGYIIKNGFDYDIAIGTTLIDTYANCGSVEIARLFFDQMPERNVVSWSSMIAAYGMHGLGEEAVALFLQMQLTGIMPNHVTFVSLLSACSHAGLVEQGWQYFNSMNQYYGIVPKVEHYACMVDLLGRAGHLSEAFDFIKTMPLEPGSNMWSALLAACRIHRNIDLGRSVADHLFQLEPANAGCYVLLSNIYAAEGRWDDVARMRIRIKDQRLKKTPGYSLIEVNHKVQAFLVGDRSHPQSEKIYKILDTLYMQMEEAGYVPDTNFVLHDVEEEVKKDMLSTHSEKLAIAFGLGNTCPGTPLRITKNLRVCGDCHNAAKFISKIAMREIYMRDAKRFHHFKDGLCSCRDYW